MVGFELLPDRGASETVPSDVYLLSDRLGGASRVEAFRLDRHLVTVHDFQRFIDDGAYDDRQWWSARGWKYIQTNDIQHPRFFHEKEWRRFVRPSRPIVGVSWFEAEAYCRFAGGRLPTEREWEAASRGTDGRRFPWGNEWDPERAAVRDTGPRVTWPVGFFRKNVGPFGHFDLVGNVWQWMADPAQPERGDDSPMVAKGGGWAARIDKNQTDVYNAFDPTDRHSHVGFRVARDH